jgi:hypothetical protein
MALSPACVAVSRSRCGSEGSAGVTAATGAGTPRFASLRFRMAFRFFCKTHLTRCRTLCSEADSTRNLVGEMVITPVIVESTGLFAHAKHKSDKQLVFE